MSENASVEDKMAGFRKSINDMWKSTHGKVFVICGFPFLLATIVIFFSIWLIVVIFIFAKRTGILEIMTSIVLFVFSHSLLNDEVDNIQTTSYASLVAFAYCSIVLGILMALIGITKLFKITIKI